MVIFFTKYNLFSKFIVFILAGFFGIFVVTTPAFACTGVYVGSQVSTNGTILIGRSNDTTPVNKPAIFKVYAGSDGAQISQINGSNGFHWDLPNKLYRTICTPSAKSTDVLSSKASINECGVSVSATVTGYSSEESLKFNNYVEDGLNEGSIPLLVGLCSSSAKEGIDLLACAIDKCGSAEDNILMISDQNEAWYMEIYGGHQYCAVKAPQDCVAVIGNEFMLETVDENSVDVVCSSDLFKVPQENGFALYNSDGKMNLFNTYAGKDRFVDYCHMRTWRGHQLLSPSTSGNYSATTKYPLFFKPDNKVDVTDVMDIFRDRYEGTEYDIDVNGKNSYRSISTETSQTTQILETYKNLPAKYSVVDWAAFANAEFNVFVPISNIETKFDDSYTYSPTDFMDVDLRSAHICYKQLNAYASQDRQKLGVGVKKYWDFVEHYTTWFLNNLINSVSDGDAQSKIDDFCSSVQNQTYYDAKRLFEDVNWHSMYTEYTYDTSVSFKTFEAKPKQQPNFSPFVDAALIAKIYGWNVNENKLQNHNPEGSAYDGKIVRDPLQNDTDDIESYLKISKNNNTIELHTGNGHRNSSGMLVINGQSEKINAKLDDGKCYVDYSFIDKINNTCGDNSFSYITPNDISSKNNLNNNYFSFLTEASIPIWCLVVIFVAIVVVVFVIKKNFTDKL